MALDEVLDAPEDTPQLGLWVLLPNKEVDALVLDDTLPVLLDIHILQHFAPGLLVERRETRGIQSLGESQLTNGVSKDTAVAVLAVLEGPQTQCPLGHWRIFATCGEPLSHDKRAPHTT